MYGNFIEGISKKGDKYGFVNEPQVRVVSGISLIFALYAFISIVFFGEYTIPTFIIGMLWFEFIYKIFIKPESLFFGKISKFIVTKMNYKKKYVGAMQKKFSWKIGLVLSTFAFVCVMIVSGFLAGFGIAVEPYNISQAMTKIPGTAVPFTPPLVACIICIIFMFLESVLGFCVGCKIYIFLTKKGIIKRVEGQNCADGSCEI